VEQTPILTDPQSRTESLEAYFHRLSSPKDPVFTSPEQWQQRRALVRQTALRGLGLAPLPERVPLDAQIVARKDYGDYRLERLWFQTLPQVWASGWLYLPASASPMAQCPAILNPHGHWAEGARAPVVQARCIALAKMGYIALAVDSVHVTHWATGVCSVGMMTWNNMRALDYLEARPDVDSARIGCTGESGGGQQTMYLMATDDRIQAAVPVVIVSYFERILFPTEQTHCHCNHVPALLRDTDAPEIVATFAPKPALYLSVTGDWTARFPQEEYPPIRAIYEALGAPERVASVQFDCGHDYSRPMRELMYAWFDRWLKGRDDPEAAREPELETETPEFLAAFDKPPASHQGDRGIFAYYLARTVAPEPQPRSRVEWEAFHREFRGQLRALLGEPVPSAFPEQAETAASADWRGYPMEPIVYASEGRFEIPALLLHPRAPASRTPAVIALAPGGKAALLENHADFVAGLLESGLRVFAPDVRFTGEWQINWDLNTVLWGRLEAGMAAYDVQRGVRYLSQRPEIDSQALSCVGLGASGVTALLCGALEEHLAAVAATDLGTTYREGRERPILPHLLRYGDLPQIAALVAPRRLWLNNAVPPDAFLFSERAYHALDGSGRLHRSQLPSDEAERALIAWLRTPGSGQEMPAA